MTSSSSLSPSPSPILFVKVLSPLVILVRVVGTCFGGAVVGFLGLDCVVEDTTSILRSLVTGVSESVVLVVGDSAVVVGPLVVVVGVRGPSHVLKHSSLVSKSLALLLGQKETNDTQAPSLLS